LISQQVLDAMLASGCTAEQIVAAVKADAAADDARRERKRAGNAERQRRFRERNARNASSRVTACDTPSPSSPHTPQLPLTPNSEPDGSESDGSGFDEVRAAYPRRDGDDPRKPAERAYRAALKRGATPAGLLEAARRYAAQHPEPTRFIPRMSTWLSEDRWKDVAPAAVPLVGTVPSIWIPERDARFALCLARYEQETGCRAKALPSQYHEGTGRSFPADWPETQSPATAAA
jgi:hypothetical protein